MINYFRAYEGGNQQSRVRFGICQVPEGSQRHPTEATARVILSTGTSDQ